MRNRWEKSARYFNICRNCSQGSCSYFDFPLGKIGKNVQLTLSWTSISSTIMDSLRKILPRLKPLTNSTWRINGHCRTFPMHSETPSSFMAQKKWPSNLRSIPKHFITILYTRGRSLLATFFRQQGQICYGLWLKRPLGFMNRRIWEFVMPMTYSIFSSKFSNRAR